MINRLNHLLTVATERHGLTRSECTPMAFRTGHLNRILDYHKYHGVATPKQIQGQLIRTSRYCKTVYPHPILVAEVWEDERG